MTHPVKSWRERAGFQAGRFAKAIGISYRTLHRLEQGQATPSVATAKRIETVTGGAVTVADIASFAEANPRPESTASRKRRAA